MNEERSTSAPKRRVLVVDDEIKLMTALCNTLAEQGYETAGFSTAAEALDALRRQEFDVLLTDMQMPETDGMDLLKEVQAIDPHLVAIMMTGHATIETAVEAIKLGAFDFVQKPLKLRDLLPVLARALEVRRLRQENLQLRAVAGAYELSVSIGFTLDAASILDKLLGAAKAQFGADEASIVTPTEDGQELCVAGACGPRRDVILGQRMAKGVGIAGWVMSHHESLILHGPVDDPRFTPVFPHDDICSAMVTPMMVGGQCMGVLNVNTTQRSRPFTPGQVKALTLLAGTAAPALQAASLHAKVQAAREEFAFNAEVGLALSQKGELRDALYDCANAAVRYFAAAFARIWTLNVKEQMLELQASAGMYTRLDGPHSRVPVGKYKIGLIAAEKTPHLTNNVYNDPPVGDQEWARREGLIAFAGYPLLVEGRLVGVMALFARKALSPITLDSLARVAPAIGQMVQRKQQEAALHESEQRLRELTEHLPLVLWMTNSDASRVLHVNPAYAKVWGRSCQSLLDDARSWIEPIHTDDRPKIQTQVERMVQGELLSMSFRLVTPDGDVRFIEDASFPIVEEDGTISRIVGFSEDVTERKKLEGQLQQAQKMEAFGQLAGGVAHDFNNLLTIITGYSELILGDMVQADMQKELIREIRKAGERAASLTRQLLAFSRKQMLQPVVLDLNALVAETDKMLRRLIGEDIDLATSLDPALYQVKADPGQIEQVIMNLVVNARDAMPTGGQLTIETKNVELDQGYARRHPEVHSGKYVMLAVADNGCGMNDDTRAKIFEPFFTTKEVGKGTGLGLATVHGIVKQSGGSIEVYSELGHGTTFKIYLPRFQDPVSPGKSLPGLSLMPRGAETVLLAEDEEGVRGIIRVTLESQGYTVLVARDGDEALHICRQRQEPIHMLLTDVVMPKMSGRQLADLVGAQRPRIKVLYLSGYTDDAIVRHGVLEADMAFLQKPFTPLILARKVREVLDR